MITLIKKISLLTIATLCVLSCQKTNPDNADQKGSGFLKLGLQQSNDIDLVEGTKSAQNTTVSLADFMVDILDANGVSYASYISYYDLPAELPLPAGKYTIQAKNGRLYGAAFDAPYFFGSTEVTMEAGLTEEIELTCAIENLKVTLDYSEELLNTLTDIEATISSKYDASDETKVGILHYNVEEKRAGWFTKPYDGKLEVYITGTNKLTGAKVASTSTILGVGPKQWRKVVADIRTSGGLGIDIVLDDTLKEQDENVTIPDDNDIVDNNGDNGNWDKDEYPDDPDVMTPSITGVALGTTSNYEPFDVKETLLFDISNGYNKLDVLLKSKSEAGFTNLKLTINSDALTSLLAGIGITGEIDLANPNTSAEWYKLFSGSEIGLIDPNDPIKGKTEHTFAVGGLMPMLWEVIKGTDNQFDIHKFVLTAVDEYGETTVTLSIMLQ